MKRLQICLRQALTSIISLNPARSAQMALVRGKNTKPEMMVRKALHAAGLRYRLQDKSLPGRPDVVLPGRRVAIQARGCMWHMHGEPSCPLARVPKTRQDFWIPKLEGNRARDERNDAALQTLGWHLEVVWECCLLRVAEREAFLSDLAKRIKAMSVVGSISRQRPPRGTPGPA